MSVSDLGLILAMALAVYAPKVLPLALLSEAVAARLRTWLHYVAPAVLGALVAPSIFAPDGHLGLPGWPGIAFVVAGLVAATTRRMVTALAAGLIVLVLTTTLLASG